MADLLNKDWPALSSENGNEALNSLSSITIEKGIFGKVDGATSDYKIIACSPGFDADHQLKNVCYLGNSEILTDFLAWSVHNNIARAIHVYPSHAKDAENRGGFLEKHILEVNISKVPDNILLAYVLALLLRVKGYKDELWWGQRRDRKWNQDHDYFIDLSNEPSINETEIKAAQKILATTMEDLLAPPYSESHLESFYNHILEDKYPILITDIEGIISEEKILALFLPLKIDVFKRKSFTTYYPSKRVKPNVLKDAWDILPIPGQELGEFEPSSFRMNNPATENLIKAIKKNNGSIASQWWKDKQAVQPEFNHSVKTKDTNTLKTRQRKAFESNQEANVNSLDRENSEKIITPEVKPLMTGRLYLNVVKESFKKPHPVIEDAYRFLHSDCQFIEEERRFSYKLQAENLLDISVQDSELLTKWLTTLQKKYPSSNGIGEDIKLKIDFFCTFYIFIIHEKIALDRILKGNFFSDKVPLLWFFYKFEKKRGDLKEYNLNTISKKNEDFIKNLVNKESLQRCSSPKSKERVDKWLEKSYSNLLPTKSDIEVSRTVVNSIGQAPSV